MKKITISTLFFLVLLVSASSKTVKAENTEKKQCVWIYYDRSPDPKYWIGRTYAIFLQNLMGHFPEFQQIVAPIELYRKGDVEKCHATFYIGSYFENNIPKAFYDDYSTTKKQIAWLGYSFWLLGEDRLKDLFGMQYSHLTKLDTSRRDKNGWPTFFKNIAYKGETFYRFGEYSTNNPKEFLASFEMTALKEVQPGKSKIISTATHNGTNEILPYIIQSENRYYITDVPFTFMHESDRYLVFADLLFDILQAKPRHNGKYAVIRIEDVHAKIPLPYMYDLINVFREENVPIHISLIPLFFDPFYIFDRLPNEEFVPMNHETKFMQMVQELKDMNSVFIWHGVTHQLMRTLNPHSGVSGDDFEFWDAPKQKPLAQDSVSFVLDRLQSGIYTLEKSNISPKLWLTPHYQASALDYTIFARVFPWNIGRVIYYDHKYSGIPHSTDPKIPSLWYKDTNPEDEKQRKKYFKDFKMEYLSDRWNGQIYPYEIYGDIYGQKLIPECLGNSQPYISSHVIRPRTVEDMAADAKRNLVIRDFWASMFFHSYLLDHVENGGRGTFHGDPKEILYLVKELKKYGYKFINLDEYVEQNNTKIRPEPIVIRKETDYSQVDKVL